jgi:hypothetical protein
MVSFRQAQTGSRVYNGAGTAPNRGRVSAQGAQGYIQRELNKNNQQNAARQGGRPVNQRGPDGKSDSRSTTAAAALSRRNSKGLKTGPGIGPGTFNQGNTFKPGPGVGKGKKKGPTGTFKPGPGVGGGPEKPDTTPDIKVKDNGSLQLPYDSEYASMALQAEQEYQNTVNDLTTQEGAADNQDLLAKQALAKQFGIDSLGTLNANASRGTAFSSAYGTQAAAVGSQYAADQSNITQTAADREALYNTAMQNALGNKNTTMEQALLAFQERLNENAGSLGYGNQRTKTPKNRKPNRSKSKSKSKGKR